MAKILCKLFGHKFISTHKGKVRNDLGKLQKYSWVELLPNCIRCGVKYRDFGMGAVHFLKVDNKQ